MKKGWATTGKSFWYVYTGIGTIGIAEDGKGISDLFFVSALALFEESVQMMPDSIPASFTSLEETNIESIGVIKETPLLRKAADQLEEYFSGSRKTFDLPLSYQGTPFQMADWNALLTIPYGETRSYKQIAQQIGRPGAYRAVGMANNRNPISIIIPCHRVIGHDGSMVGYGGGLAYKEYLLQLEQKHR